MGRHRAYSGPWSKGDRVTPRTDGGRRYSHAGEVGTVQGNMGVMTTVKWDDGKVETDWHEGNLVKYGND